MKLFSEIKENVSTRDAAEYYGLDVNRNGMVCCPFHDDRHPSMKVDKNFYCVGCQAKGDVIEFVAKLFDLSSRDAAEKIASDFGITVSNTKGKRRRKPRFKAMRAKRRKSEKREFDEAIEHLFGIYCAYLHLLDHWADEYAPKSPEDDYHPLWVEAAHKKDYVDYLLDVLLYGSTEDKAAILVEKGKEALELERRIIEFNA